MICPNVHAAPGAQHLQQLTGHVPGDGLHKLKIYLDLPKMVEYSLNSHPDPVQLSVGQQAVDWEDLHQWVVVINYSPGHASM